VQRTTDFIDTTKTKTMLCTRVPSTAPHLSANSRHMYKSQLYRMLYNMVA